MQPFLCEQLSRAEQHGRVSIVPTGVHHPGCLRFVRNIVGFFDGQRIHVGAQCDHRAAAVSERGDNTGPGDAALVLDV